MVHIYTAGVVEELVIILFIDFFKKVIQGMVTIKGIMSQWVKDTRYIDGRVL